MPIKRNLQQQLVETLGTQIISGDYQSGNTLPTADNLSEQFGVSRTVTREAIKVLEEKGLLESRPKAGIQVRSRDSWKLLDSDVMKWQIMSDDTVEFWRDLMEVRAMIEPTAARLAAERATPEDIETITYAFAELEASVDDLEAYKIADRTFHEAIFSASRNDLLIYLARTVNIDLDAGRDVTATVPRSLVESLPIHADLRDAIAAHDGEAAEACATKLVAQIAAFMEEN